MNHAPNIKTKLPGPKARKIISRDRRVLSPSLTRPYPLVIDSGEGVVVQDVDGNRFLDFTSGIAVSSTGHSHPEIQTAIQQQVAKFLHMCGGDFYYESQVELAERLCRLAPGRFPKRVFFCNSGAESVEGAFKLARYATGRKKILAFYGSFHGRTMGALSLTHSKPIQRKRFGPFVPDVVHVPYGDIDALTKKIEEILPEKLAAVFVEPIQGEGGYIVPPKGFLPSLRKLADKHKFLLVDDEVQAGMGRTGKMFAIEHWKVVPDIICLAKGIASGMPLGAFIARANVMRWKPGSHGSTFGGNPVSCVAALATLDLMKKEYMDNARRVGAYLIQQLKRLNRKHRSIQEVRGIGLMVAIEIKTPKKRDKIVQEAFKKGLLLLGCGEKAIRFSPPLSVTKKEVDSAINLLDKAVNKVR